MVRTDETFNSKQWSKNLPRKNNSETKNQECAMLFVNKKELWVSNGRAINVYNPVSGSLIDVKEKHTAKVISLSRISDINKEEYEIVSCDEKGLVCNWFSSNQQNHEKSFCLPVKENDKITHFTYGELYCVAAVAHSSNISSLVYIKNSSKTQKSFPITNGVKQGQNKVSLSYNKKYVAALKERAVYIADLSLLFNKENDISGRNHHKTGKIDQNCIAFHPSEECFVTGGMNGCITLWYNFTKASPTKIRLHWHSIIVDTLCFSATGGDLYSGNGNCVLVRWYLTDDYKKGFLPRLGMPITNLQTDPSNTYVAVHHDDDSISIVNSLEMKVEGTLQRLAKHVPVSVDSSIPLSKKILLYHTPSGSLIKPGKTGYLQFFNPHLKKVNYDLDVSMSNFATNERTRKLPNVEISNAAISENGIWLATVEMCCLSPNLKEIILKFWCYSLAAQRWELNTTVHSPHLDSITALTFCPFKAQGVPTCVSCSQDSKFKVWKLLSYKDVEGAERQLWNSQITCDYRDLPATSCAFSQDTSLLAVAFDSIVTLWCPQELVLKRILTQSFLTETITTIIFSHERWKGSALITRSENYICTWDLLSCTLIWRVYLPSSCLVIDSKSGLLATFTKSNDVFFFDPRSSEPISSIHNLELEGICAVFAPSVNQSKENMRNEVQTTLFYYDKKQNFHRIDSPVSSPEDKPSKKSEKSSSVNVESVKVGIEGDIYHSSDMFAAFSARTKNITQKESENGEVADVDLTAPSLKNLLNELHDVQIHNLSFSGLAEHMSSFLPNICIPDKSKEGEELRYETLEDERRREDTKDNFDSYYVEEKRIDDIQNYDFSKLLNIL